MVTYPAIRWRIPPKPHGWGDPVADWNAARRNRERCSSSPRRDMMGDHPTATINRVSHRPDSAASGKRHAPGLVHAGAPSNIEHSAMDSLRRREASKQMPAADGKDACVTTTFNGLPSVVRIGIEFAVEIGVQSHNRTTPDSVDSIPSTQAITTKKARVPSQPHQHGSLPLGSSCSIPRWKPPEAPVPA